MRRVKPEVSIPTVISLDSILSFDDTYGIAAPEPVMQPEDFLITDLFLKLKPGDERVVVMLRADGFTYTAIGQITGKTESQVKNVVYTIRKRLVAA